MLFRSPSLNGNLFEVVDDYILCLFEKAEGNHAELNPPLFYEMGAMMGNMHRLTKSYNDNIIQPRFEWYNGWTTWDEYNIVTDDEIQAFINRYKRELHALPITNDSYGIIHEDIHTGNFYVNDGKIKLFDFDDCQFNFYICDIATALYQITQHKLPYYLTNTNERTDFAETFLESFFKGYLQMNSIDKFWLSKIDLFINYRMATAHQFVQNITIDNPNVDFLTWVKDTLKSDTPFIRVKYEKLIP